ncbi:MAG: hypothetical protein IJ086_03485 [Clostridium sp.]|nr:hypothetical protein [Clostridium sp.]
MSSKSEPTLFSPLVTSLCDVIKTTVKLVCECLGVKHYDFKSLFRNMKFKNDDEVYPQLSKRHENEYFDIFEFSIPVGMSIVDFEKKADAFAQFFKVEKNRLRFNTNRGLAVVKVMKDTKISYDYNLDMKRKDFKIPLGRDVEDNSEVLWDITASRNTHCYIAGSTGGGKTIMLRLILTHLINSKGPADVQLLIQNTKYVDLKMFKDARNTVVYNEGRDSMIKLLKDEIKEMNRRYTILSKHDCDDIAEYRQKVGKMPYRFIVIEELSSYKTDDDGKTNRAFYSALEDLAARGRGSGQILILTTQLPSKDMLPNFIKNNINTTIGLMCKDAIRSEIIAGPDSGLEKLKGNGHAKLFPGEREFQGYYISKELANEVVANNKKKGV